MAKGRKDSRGYVLHKGESERKDGRYSFSYTDKNRERHTVYAKSLVELRKKERKIIHDIEEGLDPHAAEKITLNQLYDKYISQKFDLRPTTKANYIYTYDHFVRNKIGNMKIKNIKYTDIKGFYYDLMIKDGIKVNSIENVHNQIHPALQMAVRDGYLRVNPSDGVLGEVKKSKYGKSRKRKALTKTQQISFVNFVENEPKYRGWYPMIIFLLGTGCRIGECIGMRWDDVDFDKKTITVDHALTYRPNEKREIEWAGAPTKTEAGTRVIPMLKDVEEALYETFDIQRAIHTRPKTVGGYTNFIFTTLTGGPVNPESVNRAIRTITDDYNSREEVKAKEEGRDPVLLPRFSAHNLRHTFCTRLCEHETNLKVIQEIMGHSDIQTTMNVYAEATEERKQEIRIKLDDKILLK